MSSEIRLHELYYPLINAGKTDFELKSIVEQKMFARPTEAINFFSFEDLNY